MNTLDDLKGFPIQNSDIVLWTFKSSMKNKEYKFKERWIKTSRELDAAVREIIFDDLKKVTESLEYSILAENNESSVLTIQSDETMIDTFIEKVSALDEAKRAHKSSELTNSEFYIIKAMVGEKTLLAAKKLPSTWKTKNKSSSRNVIFIDRELDIMEKDTFEIYKSIDFYQINGNIYVRNKKNFESILRYKTSYINDFSELKEEKEFSTIFTDTKDIAKYVGENKIQLRRASAIKTKGFYKNITFMKNLKQKYKQYKLNLHFSPDGKIDPSRSDCKHIFQALLDHRLVSGFSENIYDVQDTSNVN